MPYPDPQAPTSALLSLPPEILIDIIAPLPYPDALALKHTHPLFYNSIDTSVPLKVAWLLDRKLRGLPTPQKMCCLGSDSDFCKGGLAGGWPRGRSRARVEEGASQVRSIMARRRRHGECEGGRCEVLVGWRCGGRRELDGMMMELFGLRSWGSWGVGREGWWVRRLYSLVMDDGFWVLVGLMGIVCAAMFKLFQGVE